MRMNSFFWFFKSVFIVSIVSMMLCGCDKESKTKIISSWSTPVGKTLIDERTGDEVHVERASDIASTSDYERVILYDCDDDVWKLCKTDEYDGSIFKDTSDGSEFMFVSQRANVYDYKQKRKCLCGGDTVYIFFD